MGNDTNIPKGEVDMVTEFLAETVLKAAALIEGKFMNSFEVEFEQDGKRYKISMIETK